MALPNTAAATKCELGNSQYETAKIFLSHFQVDQISLFSYCF